MTPNIQVTVIEAPITSRYCRPGSRGIIDPDTKKIRIGDAWFNFDERIWKVVTDADKETKFMSMIKENTNGLGQFPDRDFINLVEAFAITEEQAMEWMVKDKSIHRRTDGFFIDTE